MNRLNFHAWGMALAATIAIAQLAAAADHGPVFGLATPTNPKGGCSFDQGVNGRGGAGGSTSTSKPSYPAGSLSI